MSTLTTLLLFAALALLFLAIAGWHRVRLAAQDARRAANEHAKLLNAQRDLEQRAEAARRELDAVGDAALNGVLLLDGSRRILWGNAEAWELLGGGASAVGQPFIGLARDAELNQAVIDAQTGGRPIVRQTPVDSRTLRIRAVPLSDDGGVAVAIEDVTELQRLGRARRDLVGNISHELRTPLANIGLAAETLRSGAIDDPTYRLRMLDQIEGNVQTLSQLTQEMMDLSQIESGQVLLKLVATPLKPLVDQTVRMLRPQIGMKRQTVTIDVPDDLVALADEQQVGRVLTNLLHNAIKFTPDGGAIRVSGAPAEGDDVQLCISDTGPGVPVFERDRIFERFYKADRARSRGGTGLGLAIARHIVEGHGGRIWCDPTSGPGATFCFTLPRA